GARGPPANGPLGKPARGAPGAALHRLDVAGHVRGGRLGNGMRSRSSSGDAGQGGRLLVRGRGSIRGVWGRDEGGEPVPYMGCKPASHYYRIMVRDEAWARDGGKGARGDGRTPHPRTG